VKVESRQSSLASSLRRLAGVTLAIALAAPFAGAAAQDGLTPFPVSASTVLKTDGAVYAIQGRQVIEEKISIASQRAITLVGEGTDAVLVVRGALELKAVLGGKNHIQNLVIEVAPSCRSLYLSSCTFEDAGGVRSATEGPSQAKVFLEFAIFNYGTSLSLTQSGGEIAIQGCTSIPPIELRGVARSEKQPNLTKVGVLACRSAQPNGGLQGGLIVEGVSNLTVRHSTLAGEVTRLVDCATLDFDGNNVCSKKIEFRQSKPGGFAKSELHNCDFQMSRIVIFSPAQPKKTEDVALDNCWFGGREDPGMIHSTLIQDHADDPANGVVVVLTKILALPLERGGTRTD
jgi:hypothetical protein